MGTADQYPREGLQRMKALITGGSGFTGRELQRHLTAMNDDVVVVDRTSTGLDITNREAVMAAIADAKPDVVYHLAAQAHVPTAWDDPVTTMRCNVEGTLNVLDAADRAGAGRVILASSADVYGSVEEAALPIDESTEARPNNPYAASKLAAEALAIQSFHGRGQDVIRLRVFNAVGPGQRPEFACSGIAHRIAAAESANTSEIQVGRLDVRRDFIDIRDVVRAYRLAAVAGRPGAVYNVCSGTDRSIEEIAHGLAQHSSQDVHFTVETEHLRPVDTPVVRGNAAAISTDTGWSTEIPFETTLIDVLEDARKALA